MASCQEPRANNQKPAALEDFVPIGRFSKICRLSISALRYYDELGLLRPALVDPDSSYRYYRLSQVRIAETIRLLRAMDMPLDEVRRFLAVDDPAAAPVAIQWNEGLLARDDLAIIKGARNRENALKFCAFASLPAPQARFSMQIPYGFVNFRAAELIPPAQLAQLPTSPEILPKLFPRDEIWWAQDRDVVIERWNEWILE